MSHIAKGKKANRVVWESPLSFLVQGR
jgi:hypothetical protein